MILLKAGILNKILVLFMNVSLETRKPLKSVGNRHPDTRKRSPTSVDVEIPSPESYQKILEERKGQAKSALRLRRENLTLAETEEAQLLARLQAIAAEKATLAREVAHGELAMAKYEGLQQDLGRSTMDIDWYEEEQRKQDLRELIDLILRKQTFSDKLKEKHAHRLIALVLAARVNEDILLEYLSEQRRLYTEYVDTAIAKTEGNRDIKIEECLRWALKKGYLKIPAASRRTPLQDRAIVGAETPSKRAPLDGVFFAAAGITPPVVAIWNKIVQEEQAKRFSNSVTTVMPARKYTAAFPLVEKRRPHFQKYEPTALANLAETIRSGDQLEIVGLIADKDGRCQFLVDSVQKAPDRLTLLVHDFIVDRRARAGTFTVHLPLKQSLPFCVITQKDERSENIALVLQGKTFNLAHPIDEKRE